ncbi:MAG: transketolase [Acidobacteriota bacterium]
MTESRSPEQLDALCIDTIRMLAVDAVQRAESGHPGMPMGTAAMAYVLWMRHLRFHPDRPDWPDRDRFVLSAGHGSMLLYALLHLTGYDLPMEEIRDFRQWGSATPGHPEVGDTPGVETTTGPLGQGFGNAVGMAIAEARLAAEFNRGEHRPVDHHTYVIASDGDIMEGVQSEAASLAGHLGLGKLVVLYDDNRITIDGATDLAFSEDVPARYRAYGWHTASVADGNDLEAVDAAIREAREVEDRPSLIAVRTHIGFGSPGKQDTAAAHGAPLGEEEVARTKENLGWPLEPAFLVPDGVREHMARGADRGREAEAAWRRRLEAWRAENPELAAEWDRRLAGELTPGWDGQLPRWSPDDGPVATRVASGDVLNALAGPLPELFGGSADLSPSNKTVIDGSGDFGRDHREGRNLRFGVREHAMGAITNGIVLHRGLRPYCGTFLIFSDYMRPSIRLAALMELPGIYVFTHDSIALGEDGPTHQPIEQLPSLRAIPKLLVLRPADANETREAWRVALQQRDRPAALLLTRQKLPVLPRTADDGKVAEGVARGGYVLADAEGAGDPEIILIASGSEVAPAFEAWRRLVDDGVAARVVSLPCQELFREQGAEYREAVLPSRVVRRLGVEAARGLGWHRWVGDRGDVIEIDRFGASAPGAVNMEKLGFDATNVEKRARALLEG